MRPTLGTMHLRPRLTWIRSRFCGTYTLKEGSRSGNGPDPRLANPPECRRAPFGCGPLPYPQPPYTVSE